MKVYALFAGQYSDRTLFGCFSSEEKASAWLDAYLARANAAEARDEFMHYSDRLDWKLETHTMDVPQHWMLDEGAVR